MNKKIIILAVLVLIVATVIVLAIFPGSRPPIYIDEDMKRCEVTEDCVAVGCSCYCSGCGGFAFDDIVNKEFADAWYRQYDCRPAEVCPEVCCPPVVIACENKVCTTKEVITNLGKYSEEAIERLAIDYLLSRKDELDIRDVADINITKVTPYNNRFTIRYTQSYKGIPVHYSGSSALSMESDGEVYNIKHYWYRPEITSPVTAEISAKEAEDIAKVYYKAVAIDFFEETKLYILPPDKLVWEVKMAEPVYKDAFINAITGEIVSEYDNLMTE